MLPTLGPASLQQSLQGASTWIGNLVAFIFGSEPDMSTSTSIAQSHSNAKGTPSCCDPISCNSSGRSISKRRWRLFLVILVISSVFLFSEVMYGPMPLEEHRRSAAASKEQVTIVMNTFKRHDMMESAIQHYSQCPIVKHIYIIWSESDAPPERITAKYASRMHPQVIFSVQQVDSLNNRFLPIQGDHTDSIFAVDDDMRVSCVDLDLGFEVWRNSPHNLVGYMPRIHLRQSDGSFVYRCWWRVWWHGLYSIILTKAAFLHHKYLEYYSNEMPKTIRDLVDEKRNCEDIAMQFMIANITTLPPIYVKGNLEDLGALNGISTSKSIVGAGHMDQRSQCLNDLTRIYGNNPLVSSHIIVDNAHNGWTNAPSTWFEYISSDLWKF